MKAIIYNKLLTFKRHLFFKKKVHCNVCGWKGVGFNAVGSGHTIRYNASCPECGSAERHREFVKFLDENDFIESGARMLEIGPNKGFRQYFESKGLKYFAIGLHSDYVDSKMDARNMDLKDNQFDYIVSSHVLSFIRDDMAVMAEMYRVLKKHGLCIVIEPHDLTRKRTIEFNRESKDGIRDNVRKYGADIIAKLESAGFKVKIIHAVSKSFDRKKYGLYKNGYTFFFCEKS